VFRTLFVASERRSLALIILWVWFSKLANKVRVEVYHFWLLFKDESFFNIKKHDGGLNFLQMLNYFEKQINTQATQKCKAEVTKAKGNQNASKVPKKARNKLQKKFSQNL